MKAIVTSYKGPTNTRGARIYARAEGGHSISISYPHDAEGEKAHWLAADALRKKLKWTGEMVAGGLPNGDTVFVFTEYHSGSKTERFNPAARRKRPRAGTRTPAQKAATARMLAANRKRRQALTHRPVRHQKRAGVVGNFAVDRNPAPRKVRKLRVLTARFKIQVKRGAQWRTLDSCGNKAGAVKRGTALAKLFPSATLRVFWK